MHRNEKLWYNKLTELYATTRLLVTNAESRYHERDGIYHQILLNDVCIYAIKCGYDGIVCVELTYYMQSTENTVDRWDN